MEIKRSAVVEIYKEIRKCDSLKVAYNQKSIELNNLITTNLSIFTQLESERTKRLQAEEQIKILNTKIKKESRNTKDKLLIGVGGITTGLIIGILISN